MQHLNVIPSIADTGTDGPTLDQYAPITSAELVAIGGMAGATESGKAGAVVVVKLPDGTHAAAMATHALFNGAARALVARHGDPNRDENFPSVCLVGSTKFMDTFRDEAQRLTLAGSIVLAPFIVTSEQVTSTDPDTKAMLNAMHFRKIDMADTVHVVNPGGYIGDATRAELEYATSIGKPITWLVTPA